MDGVEPYIWLEEPAELPAAGAKPSPKNQGQHAYSM